MGDYKEKAAEAHSNTLSNFAQGGLTMNNQTQMAFALGGEAETIDPVSGNDVPPGSLPAEVRDDLPARLSEGEYVVPADVVRFFGVKFFENLRAKAKIGLQQMDADGRIGGDPVPSMGEATLSDEDFEKILTAELSKSQPETEKAFAHGGLHTENKSKYTSNLNTLGFGGNYNFGSTPTGSSATTEVTLYSPEGVAQVVQRPSSLYDTLIMAGYTTTNPIATTPEKPIVSQDNDGESDPVKEADPNAWMEGFKYDSAKSLYESSVDSLNPPTGVGGAISRVIGGLSPFLGALGAASKAAMVGGNLAILKEQKGQPGFDQEQYDLLETKLQDYITANGLENMPQEYYNGDQYAKQINANKTDFALGRESTDWRGNKIFKSDDEWNAQMQKTGPTGMTWIPNPTEEDSGYGSYETPSGNNIEVTTSLRPKLRPGDLGGSNSGSGGNSNSTSSSDSGGSSSSTGQSFGEAYSAARAEQGGGGTFTYNGSSFSTNTAEEEDAADDYSLGHNKGGLITKPKKTKKKTKAYKKGGLASKK